LSFSTRVDSVKALFWIQQLQDILSSEAPSPRIFEQIAGKLSFACFSAYGKAAKSRLRFIYKASHPTFDMHLHKSSLVAELSWWLSKLSSGFCRCQSVPFLLTHPSLIYTDAEGDGGLGIVWSRGSSQFWWRSHLPQSVFSRLLPRKTQIHFLEAIVVLLAIDHDPWPDSPAIFMIDNLAVAHNMDSGKSDSPEVNEIVHLFYDRLSRGSRMAYIWWIPSRLNVADDPSRGKDPVQGVYRSLKINYSKVLIALDGLFEVKHHNTSYIVVCC
jgi:hypothetical protein